MKLDMRCPYCGHHAMRWGEPTTYCGEIRSDVFSCRACGSAHDLEDIRELALEYADAVAAASADQLAAMR